MIALAVKLDQPAPEVPADLGHDGPQALDGVTVKDPLAVLGHEDQMDVEIRDAVSTVSKLLLFHRKTNILLLVQILKAYRFELRPTSRQERLLAQFVGCRRWCYNQGLAEGVRGYAALCKRVNDWKASFPFLCEAPIHVLQQALKDLDRAWQNHRATRAEEPTRKRKFVDDACRFPDPGQFKVDTAHGRVKLPKLGWLRYHKSREVAGEPRNITVSRQAGRWFVSIQCRLDVADPRHPSSSAVGLDMGVATFAALSDGEKIVPISSFWRHEGRLAKAQKALARKRKGSTNRRKAKVKVNRLHWRIANVRRDYLHKVSTQICKNHAIICLEDLDIRNMSRSAKGTADQPGKNVKAKSGLNKAILDQGWGMFRQFLEYKAGWLGGTVVAVPPQYTSQICAACGAVDPGNRKSQAEFACTSCGHRDHADVNAACNILRAGLARLACAQDPSCASRARGSKRKLVAGTVPATCEAGNHRALAR